MKKQKKNIITISKVRVISVGAILGVIMLVLFLTLLLRNVKTIQEVLESRIEQNMLVLAKIAEEHIEEHIGADKFLSYTDSMSMNNDPVYHKDLEYLRRIAKIMDVEYLYAIRKFGDEYRFIYDTDEEDRELFGLYKDVPEVHLRAFKGEEATTVYGGDDNYGEFSTGSVPLLDNKGEVVGVVATDIKNTDLKKVRFRNFLMLLMIAIIILVYIFILLLLLYKNFKNNQIILYKQANFDRLTNIPNRRFLFKHLEIITAEQNPFFLLFIDVDNFKSVNDYEGHEAGDYVLRSIASYLSSICSNINLDSNSATSFVARVGGDEFIMIISKNSMEDVKKIAQEIIDNIHNEISNENVKRFNLGLSIGIATFPTDAKDFNSLINCADKAMYNSKSSGKSMVSVFDKSML